MSGPPRPDERGERGRAAERLAQTHLERAGLRLIARNVRGKAGEIDLVMSEAEPGGDEALVVFVEVRSRSSSEVAGPAETVDGRKQRRIIQVATEWLVATGRWDRVAVRFDVVAIEEGERVDWIRHAFDASPRGR